MYSFLLCYVDSQTAGALSAAGTTAAGAAAAAATPYLQSRKPAHSECSHTVVYHLRHFSTKLGNTQDGKTFKSTDQVCCIVHVLLGIQPSRYHSSIRGFS